MATNRYYNAQPYNQWQPLVQDTPVQAIVAMGEPLRQEFNRRQDNFSQMMKEYRQFVSRSTADMDRWYGIVGESLNPLVETMAQNPDFIKTPDFVTSYQKSLSGLAMNPELARLQAGAKLWDERAKTIQDLKMKGQYDETMRPREEWDSSLWNSLDPKQWEMANTGIMPTVSQHQVWSQVGEQLKLSDTKFDIDPETGTMYIAGTNIPMGMDTIIDQFLNSGTLNPQIMKDWNTQYQNAVANGEKRDFKSWLYDSAKATLTPYVQSSIQPYNAGNRTGGVVTGKADEDGGMMYTPYDELTMGLVTNRNQTLQNILQKASHGFGIKDANGDVNQDLTKSPTLGKLLLTPQEIEAGKTTLTAGEAYTRMVATRAKLEQEMVAAYQSGDMAAFNAAKSKYEMIEKPLRSMIEEANAGATGQASNSYSQYADEMYDGSSTIIPAEDVNLLLTGTNKPPINIESTHGFLKSNRRRGTVYEYNKNELAPSRYEIVNQDGRELDLKAGAIITEHTVSSDKIDKIKAKYDLNSSTLVNDILNEAKHTLSSAKNIYVEPSTAARAGTVNGKSQVVAAGSTIYVEESVVKEALKGAVLKKLAGKVTDAEAKKIAETLYDQTKTSDNRKSSQVIFNPVGKILSQSAAVDKDGNPVAVPRSIEDGKHLVAITVNIATADNAAGIQAYNDSRLKATGTANVAKAHNTGVSYSGGRYPVQDRNTTPGQYDQWVYQQTNSLYR